MFTIIWGIIHGGADILVAEQFLDRADVITIRKQMSRKAVAKGMETNGLDNCTQFYRFSNSLLNTADVLMMSSFHFRVKHVIVKE